MFLWSSVFGAAFAAVRILIDILLTRVVLQRFSANAPVSFKLLSVLGLVTLVPCVAIAAFLAGALSRRFVSGLIAGIVLVVVSQGLSLLVLFATLPPVRSVGTLAQLALPRLIVTVVYLLLGAGVGAGGGAVGAVVGQAWGRRSPSPPVPAS
jgi:hypothetical protein